MRLSSDRPRLPSSGLNASDWLRAQAEAIEEAIPGANSRLSEVFAEEPVSLDVFVRDRKFISMSELSVPQYGVLQAAERIYYTDLYPVMAAEWPYWQPIPMVNLLTILSGKGSGKDMISRLASLRIAYLLLCLKDPKTYFGFPSDESIHMLNVASTKNQARLAFFEPMTRIVARGWFKDKCTPLRSVIEWQNGITSISGSSDAETQEGLNLILGVADEVDAFRTAEEVLRQSGPSQRMPIRSVEGIIKMLRTSSSTRFPQTFKNLRISYPRYFGSPILQLHAAAVANIAKRGTDSRHFVVGPLPSWDFNPLLARSTFVDIPQSPVPVPIELVEEFESDPEWSRAAYLCRPARTRLPPYFRNETVIDAALIESPEILVNWELVRGAWHAVFSIPRALQPQPGAVYACHADLALTGDRCGFAFAHVVSWDTYEKRDAESGDKVRYEHLPVVCVDAALVLEADLKADPPREIQLRAIRQLIFELRERGFGFAWASLDGYMSADSKQALIVAGIEAEILSTDKTEEPYRLLRSMVEEARVTLPSSLLLRNELRGLQQDPRTRKIDHQPGAGCFIGDTRIPLLNGTYPMISELVGQKVWLYSSTPTGQIVPGKACGRFTKMTSEFVDVILDNGYVARCTPDHLWKLRNGDYKAAIDLVPYEDRLMPISFGLPRDGGYVYVTDMHGDRRRVHRLVAEFFAERKALNTEIIHHIDHIKLNNEPSNLEIVDSILHSREHSTSRWKKDAEFAEISRTATQQRWASDPEYVARFRAGYAAWNADEERKREMYARRRNVGNRTFRRPEITIESFQSVSDSPNINQAARRVGITRNSAVARLKKAGYSSWDEFVNQTGENHKVRAVIEVCLSEPVPVYDLEVEEWSNFALPGGVFVHNSKDLSDSVCGAVWGATLIGGSETTEGEHSGDEFWTAPAGITSAAVPIGAEAVWSSIFDR